MKKVVHIRTHDFWDILLVISGELGKKKGKESVGAQADPLLNSGSGNKEVGRNLILSETIGNTARAAFLVLLDLAIAF